MECPDQVYAYYESDLLNFSIIKIVNNKKLYKNTNFSAKQVTKLTISDNNQTKCPPAEIAVTCQSLRGANANSSLYFQPLTNKNKHARFPTAGKFKLISNCQPKLVILLFRALYWRQKICIQSILVYSIICYIIQCRCLMSWAVHNNF